jgi:predicted nucleic acid-binding protein
VKGLVLDASLALEWFSDDASPASLAKRTLLDEHVVLVPHLWRFEVMNAVTVWLRRGAVTQAHASWLLTELLSLPFAVVEEGDPEAILGLAHEHRLTACDAAYLHVAMMSGEPLATLDRALHKAAIAVGVTCL